MEDVVRALCFLLFTGLVALGCGSEPAPGPSDVLASGDGGIADLPLTDGSIPDIGPPDSGPEDAEVGMELGADAEVGPDAETGPDGGSGSGTGVLSVFPEPVSFPGGEGSLAEVSVRNLGPGPVRVARVAVRTADDQRDSSDFVFETCGAARCELDVELCDPAEAGCGGESAAVLLLRYTNGDGSERDDGIFRVEVTGRAPLDVPVLASRIPCPSPTARLALDQPAADLSVGDTVVINGTSSDPGGDARNVAYYFWTLDRQPGALAPRLSGQGMPLVSFTATAAGAHSVTLAVTNDCGQTSATPGRLDFVVPR